jgi:hypothetical protein
MMSVAMKPAMAPTTIQAMIPTFLVAPFLMASS